jgi:hypothetical protein
MFPGGGIIVIASDDSGVTWQELHTEYGITFSGDYKNFKLIQGPANSIYLFAQKDNMLYVKRIDELSGLWASQIEILDFDVVFSEALNKFLLLYTQTDNTLYMREIILQNGYFSNGATAQLNMGVNSPKLVVDGNTLGISFMFNHFLPKESSPIVHYAGQIAANGTIALSNPVNAVPEGVIKTEYKTAILGEKVWVVYAESANNQVSIKGNFSLDGGYTFSIPQNIALAITSNNYWLNLKKNKTGFDLVYYSDQVQTGASTNETDKIVYGFNGSGSYSSFIYHQRVSSHVPYWSSRNQVSELVPLLYSSAYYDIGVLWIGFDGSGSKLYWNKFTAVTGIEEEKPVPSQFVLNQNYPNPFNPSTTINYSIPKAEFVSLKVFDLLGREVATLVNEYKQAGKHNCEFRIENGELPSGVYFYKLTTPIYSATKKLMLIK